MRQVQWNRKTTAKVHKFSNGSRATSKGTARMGLDAYLLLHERQAGDSDLLEAVQASARSRSPSTSASARTSLLECAENSPGFSSDSDGTADLTISGVAADELQVR